MRKLNVAWISISTSLFLLTLLSAPAGAQFLPGDASSFAAAGTQAYARIARGGNGYLLVWSDTRTVLAPIFLGTGGPYNGDGLGTMTDIYAARLDATGKLLDSTPIVIAEAMYNQMAPQVGWNGQNWLVVWVSERSTNRYDQDTLAARVAPDGTVLDDPPLVLNTANTSGNPFTPWSVSSDGSNWTIACRGLDVAAGIFTIEGLRVANDGTILNPGGTVLREDFWNSGATNAELAFAGDEYLLTWLELDAGTGTWMVRGQRLSPTLAPIGSVFNIDLLGFTKPNAPRVASDGTGFLVVWFEDRYYGWAQIFGARVSHTGQVVDANGIAITQPAGYTQFAPDVAWDGRNYIVAYNKQQTGFDDDIYVTRVSGTGAVLDSVLMKGGATSQQQPTIAAAATGGAQIAWTDYVASDGTPDVVSAAFSSAGAVSASIVASRGAPRQRSPRVAAGAGEFLAVFASQISGESRIAAQRLDAAGNAMDAEPILLSRGTPTAAHPSVAWNGSEFLAVWEDAGQILGRQVLPNGALLDATPFLIMRGAQPDVAALGDTFLVVGSDAPLDPHYRFTFAVRVSGNGAVFGSPLQVSGSFTVSPAVVALGERWLVVWEGHPTHDSPWSSIGGAFVSADGSSPGQFGISDGGSDASPALASSGSAALIAWADADIFGRRILADGTLLDTASGLVISNAPGAQFSPAVAWDGTVFVLDWVDERNDPYPNQERGDIYGARVSAAGGVLDSVGFAVANSPLPEETPTVVSGNGTTLFAYAAFNDRAPYAAFRIALRRYPFDQAYTVSVTPSAQTVAAGGSATFSVTVAPVGTFSDTVNLSAFGLPPGAGANFTPASLVGGGTSSLVISVPANTVDSAYDVTVAGTSGALQSTAQLTLTVGAGPSSCPNTLSYASIAVPYLGASAWFTISTGASCSWTAVSNAPWITITSGSSGTGYGEVDFSAAANPTTTTRTGTITAGGQVFTVYQSAAPCTYSLSPTSQALPAIGGSGSLNVVTQAGCAWTAASNVAWLTVTSGNSWSGSGLVYYSASANSSTTQRIGTLTVAGQTFTVTEAPLLFSVSGRVSSNGASLAKVTMTFSVLSGTGKAPASVVTDSNGNWSQTGFQFGTTYVVTPSRQRYIFSPGSWTFSVVSSSLNFTATR